MNYSEHRSVLLDECRRAKESCNVTLLNLLENALRVLNMLEKQEQEMPKEQVMAYASRMWPVIREYDKTREENVFYWIKPQRIHNESCLFVREKVYRAEGLQEIARIESYHRYGGCPVFLRPSVDEAILQCPRGLLDQVCAFEFVSKSDEIKKVYDKWLDRHILQTIYYAGKLPEDLAQRPVLW